MQVKGTGIKTTKEFVLKNFPDDYEGWIESLSIESKPYFVETTNFTRWYPIKEAYIDPGNKIIELFFQGDIKAGGEALGRFSANYALKGIYKVFLLVASPKHLINRAQKINNYLFSTLRNEYCPKKQ